jgi:integrase
MNVTTEHVDGLGKTRGAESSGDVDGMPWHVFTIKDRSRMAHVLSVTCAPGMRKKMRIPRKHSTAETRARFARGAAVALVKEWREEQARQAKSITPIDPTKITFDEFGKLYTSGGLAAMYPGHVKPKDTIDGDIQRLAFMKPLVGDVALVDFQVEHGEKVLAAIPKGRSQATLRHYGQTLHHLLALAVYPGKILTAHPLPPGFLPKLGPTRAKSFLYPEEDAALMACAAVPRERRILYGFLDREGPRYGEAASLQWSDLDLDKGVVVLDQTKTDDPRSWRLAADVVRALEAHRDGHPDPSPSGRVFLDENGAPFEGKKLAARFRADLELAGVTRPQLFERSAERLPIRVHDLRATFVTLALAIGRTETWVCDRTGHKSSAMVARYKRPSRVAAELNLGWLRPLDECLAGEKKSERPSSEDDDPDPDAEQPKSDTCSADCSASGTGVVVEPRVLSDSSTILAESKGFEPLVPLQVHLISNQAPSATRSALHRRRKSIIDALSSGLDRSAALTGASTLRFADRRARCGVGLARASGRGTVDRGALRARAAIPDELASGASSRRRG